MMLIALFVILSIFTILTFFETLVLQSINKQKKILELTLKEAFFQKRTLVTTVLLIIIPSPILFFYFLYEILKRNRQCKK